MLSGAGDVVGEAGQPLETEQYALPEAVTLLRSLRREGGRPIGSGPLQVAACDPLNFQGILTPETRVAATAGLRVAVG